MLGSNKRHKTEDKRAIELSRWFVSSSDHHHQHHQQQQQQQQKIKDEDDSLIEWTSHAWTFDELLRLYSKKLPVIVRPTRGYYGQPGDMKLDIGQVGYICYTCTVKPFRMIWNFYIYSPCPSLFTTNLNYSLKVYKLLYRTIIWRLHAVGVSDWKCCVVTQISAAPLKSWLIATRQRTVTSS